MENFKIDIDADGIAVIAFDVPGRSMNTLTSAVMKEIPELVERIKTDETIKGAVITSGKASASAPARTCATWRAACFPAAATCRRPSTPAGR